MHLKLWNLFLIFALFETQLNAAESKTPQERANLEYVTHDERTVLSQADDIQQDLVQNAIKKLGLNINGIGEPETKKDRLAVGAIKELYNTGVQYVDNLSSLKEILWIYADHQFCPTIEMNPHIFALIKIINELIDLNKNLNNNFQQVNLSGINRVLTSMIKPYREYKLKCNALEKVYDIIDMWIPLFNLSEKAESLLVFNQNNIRGLLIVPTQRISTLPIMLRDLLSNIPENNKEAISACKIALESAKLIGTEYNQVDKELASSKLKEEINKIDKLEIIEAIKMLRAKIKADLKKEKFTEKSSILTQRKNLLKTIASEIKDKKKNNDNASSIFNSVQTFIDAHPNVFNLRHNSDISIRGNPIVTILENFLQDAYKKLKEQQAQEKIGITRKASFNSKPQKDPRYRTWPTREEINANYLRQRSSSAPDQPLSTTPDHKNLDLGNNEVKQDQNLNSVVHQGTELDADLLANLPYDKISGVKDLISSHNFEMALEIVRTNIGIFGFDDLTEIKLHIDNLNCEDIILNNTWPAYEDLCIYLERAIANLSDLRESLNKDMSDLLAKLNIA